MRDGPAHPDCRFTAGHSGPEPVAVGTEEIGEVLDQLETGDGIDGHASVAIVPIREVTGDARAIQPGGIRVAQSDR